MAVTQKFYSEQVEPLKIKYATDEQIHEKAIKAALSGGESGKQSQPSNDISSLVTEFADKVSKSSVQRNKIINKLNAISNKNTDLTNAQWLKKSVDDGKDVLRGMVDQYKVSKIEYEFAQFLKGDLPDLNPSVSDKVKKVTVGVAKNQYDRNSWLVNDLQGHSSEEFKNRNVPMLINPKIEETKAIIAQGVNGGAGADWVEKLQNSLARMEKQLEKWNKVNGVEPQTTEVPTPTEQPAPAPKQEDNTVSDVKEKILSMLDKEKNTHSKSLIVGEHCQ